MAHAEDGAASAVASPKDGKKAMAEKHGAEMFEKADTNKDGFLSKDEMLSQQRARLDEMFATTDTNNDGKLSREEMKKGRELMHEKFKAKMEAHKKEREALKEKPADAPHE